MQAHTSLWARYMDRFYSSIKESNTPEHVLVINAVIRKLLRCSSVRHQALFVPWALSVQRDISERVEAGSKSSSIGAPHAWAPWAKLGHQLVAGVLMSVASELPCERLANHVLSVTEERQRTNLTPKGLAFTDGALVLAVDAGASPSRRSPSGSAGAGAGAGAGAVSMNASPSLNASPFVPSAGQHVDLTYWRMLGGQLVLRSVR